ncbi:gamma-glutamyl-gamma-aminobutyrate hydrolase family protein [Parasalinivibrio latis]|uniref:gamma-glutamyl-gamma-aminobutyrate hydrolase family protein n=1 Tax=Parasalinivibrio latis TaxID=2952610 RepID=UPI0030E2129E
MSGKNGSSLGIRPVVGVTACTSVLGLHRFHIAGDKYLRAVTDGATAMPMVFPALADAIDITQVLETVDGLMFTGSPSNIEPYHYCGPESAEGTQHDPDRDAMTLPLLKAAIESGIPVLAICRGFQEMNVVMGGTLHQRLHETGRYIEHREDTTQSADVQYGLSHTIHVEPGGLLFEAWGQPEAEVNSVHTQGVDRLGNGLRVEATAPDGLIEAFSVADSRGFALGVQWHPEWKVTESPFYSAIFKLFGDACRQRAMERERTR